MNKERIQRLFWAIAGAEIDVIEKCKTDHKKFAAIGATIAMTAFIAFLAGTSAAWYFTSKGGNGTGSIGWSLAFGLVWSLLIFCIDRSLVITLKKDPTRKHQKVLAPLISRALLAVIIAFMVSIPLELYIFEDYIKAKEPDYKQHQKELYIQHLKAYQDKAFAQEQISKSDSTMAAINKQLERIDGELGKLQRQIDSLTIVRDNPNSVEYNAAKRKYDDAVQKYNDASKNYNAEKRKENPNQNLLNTYQQAMDAQNTSKRAAKSALDNAAKVWKEPRQKKIDELSTRLQEKKDDKLRREDSYNTELVNKKKFIEDKNSADTLIRTGEAEKDSLLTGGNPFIKNFQILEYAVWQRDKDGNLTDTTQLLFLWLVRLLFFIIEILPTIVKIVTPVGSYDRMVYAEEDGIKDYLESQAYKDMLETLHKEEEQRKVSQLKNQRDVEAEMRSEILSKIKDAQIEVANKAIATWKKTELSKFHDEEDDDSSSPEICI